MGVFGQYPKHRSPEQPGGWSRVRVLLETQPSFLQTQCADELIELVPHMENIVARTTQLPLSQTSLDLPALNMSRAMLGGLVNISTFFNLFTKNMTRTLWEGLPEGQAGHLSRGFRSDTPAGLWSLHHLAKTRPGQHRGEQGEEELQGAQQNCGPRNSRQPV